MKIQFMGYLITFLFDQNHGEENPFMTTINPIIMSNQ